MDDVLTTDMILDLMSRQIHHLKFKNPSFLNITFIIFDKDSDFRPGEQAVGAQLHA